MHVILQDFQLNYFVSHETKLDKSFPTASFTCVDTELGQRKIEINMDLG